MANSINVHSGFYNSNAKDRTYDAVDLSSIFDGLIGDGIIQHYGNRFEVGKVNNSLQVSVKSGRAWFNHIWVVSDSEILLDISAGNPTNPRTDTIAIQIDTSNARAACLKVIEGITDISGSEYNTETLHTYAIARVLVPENARNLNNATITNLVGTETTPYSATPPLSDQVQTQIQEYLDNLIGDIDTEDVLSLIESRKVFNTYFYLEATRTLTEFRTLPTKGNNDILIVDNSGFPTSFYGFYPEINRTFNVGDILLGSSGRVAMVTTKPVRMSFTSGSSTAVMMGMTVRGVGTIADGVSDLLTRNFIPVNEEANYNKAEQELARRNINAEQGYLDITRQYEEWTALHGHDVFQFLVDQDDGKYMVSNEDGIYYSQNSTFGITKIDAITDDHFYIFRLYNDGVLVFEVEVQYDGHVNVISGNGVKVPQDPSDDSDVINYGTLKYAANMIAAEYDPTLTYRVGDYCRHGLTFYRCNYRIQTPESWTAAHWIEISIAEVVSIDNTRALVFADFDFPYGPGYTGNVQTNFVPLANFWPRPKSGDFALGRNGILAYISGVNGNYAQCNYGTFSLTKCLSITRSALLQLRDNGKLIPGMRYRITDYVCTSSDSGTSANINNAFDIIVTALTPSSLSEDAEAALHEGDTYYSEWSANLSGWKLKYCIDNDVSRFGWAIDDRNDVVSYGTGLTPGVTTFQVGDLRKVNNSIYRCIQAYTAPSGSYSMPSDKWEITVYGTGKGVIYWMQDEWGNEAPYDFKQIMFKRYKITACAKAPSLVGKYAGSNHSSDITVDLNDYDWFYTFSAYDTQEDYIRDASVCQYGMESDVNDCYEKCYGNMILQSVSDTQKVMVLPNNVFYGEYDELDPEYLSPHGNILGVDCTENTFGNNCHDNMFGCQCSKNTFGDDCYENSFGSECSLNAFGTHCFYNSLGNNSKNNVLDTECRNNVLEGGTSYVELSSYSRDNVVESGVEYTQLTNATNPSVSNYLQNYCILCGTKGTSSSRVTVNADRNRAYPTYVGKNSSGTVKTWCPADLVS